MGIREEIEIDLIKARVGTLISEALRFEMIALIQVAGEETARKVVEECMRSAADADKKAMKATEEDLGEELEKLIERLSYQERRKKK